MKYSDARNSIKSGDLLAWTHRSWSSLYDIEIQIVRTVTQSEYCHVGIAWVIAGRVFVLEAVKPRSRIYMLSKLGSFFLLPMDADWSPEVEERALGLVGLPYSNWECIKAYFEESAPEGEEVIQCAKMARLILMALGKNIGDKATPAAVVQAALESGAELIYVKGET